MSDILKQKHKELLEQAQALLDKAQEMENLIKEEEDIPVDENIFGLVKEQDRNGGEMLVIEQDDLGEFFSRRIYGETDHPTFRTEESAKEWINVIEVMLLLRCQEGVMVNEGNPGDGVYIWIGDEEDKLYTETMFGIVGMLSPAFSSSEYAQKAIDNVGEERITKAIKTLEGIKQ